MNKLYFGDNLDVLKDLYHEHPDGFIDLIYIDPPFNSKRNYNVLFESLDKEDIKAQKEAFTDTWSNVSYLDTLNEILDLDINLHNYLSTLDNIGISKGAISYLCTMALRIWYMRKVLNDTGSFYLHCDPTMSHYLKIICDLIFENKNFRNEIVWHYKRWSNVSKNFQRMHDIILFYSKSSKYIFNILYQDYSKPESIETTVRGVIDGKLQRLKDEKGNYIKRKKENIGVAMHDVFDLQHIQPTSKERLGYPTQKPEELLERIIEASSNESDIVADFCCGCGTAIAVAQKLKRKWIGADISHLAIKLVTSRLLEPYKDNPEKYKKIRNSFEIFGFPKDVASAIELATSTKKGRLKFESWIIEVMLHGVLNPNRTQMGFDGYLTFDVQNKKETVLIEVKSGNTGVSQLNHFISTVNDKSAVIGVFVCFKKHITKGMVQISKKQGYYSKEFFGSNYDKIQLISVEDLLEHKTINIPISSKVTFKKAKKTSTKDGEQSVLFN